MTGKKCIMCGEAAQFVIKDSSDAYCESCAIECFSDTSLLQHIEEQARELKELIKEEVQERLQESEQNKTSVEESASTAELSNKTDTSSNASTEEDLDSP